jgi:hypothetical protein
LARFKGFIVLQENNLLKLKLRLAEYLASVEQRLLMKFATYWTPSSICMQDSRV